MWIGDGREEPDVSVPTDPCPSGAGTDSVVEGVHHPGIAAAGREAAEVPLAGDDPAPGGPLTSAGAVPTADDLRVPTTDDLRVPTTDDLPVPTTDDLRVPTTDDLPVPTTDDLPAPTRRRLAELAAAALGHLPEREVPPALRRIRAFAPTRRAKAAFAPLLAALDHDPVLRGHAALLWSKAYPEVAARLPGPGQQNGAEPTASGPSTADFASRDLPASHDLPATNTIPSTNTTPSTDAGKATDEGQDVDQGSGAGDPAAVSDAENWLLGAFLSRPPGWPDLVGALVARLAERESDRQARHAEAAARARADAVAEELGRARAELAQAQAQNAALTEEIGGLRRDQRRLRADADRARAAARAAEQEAARAAEQARLRSDDAEVAMRRAAEQVARAEERLAQARRLAREGRSLADVRARLLLDTIVDAAAGLRRELALPPVTQRPADLVVPQAVDVAGPAPAPPARAQAGDDPALLEQLLALPQSHLVVDGYNVTKTGYGALPLAEQRRRLVDALGVLAVRTTSEVTCCFDGADVDVRGASRVRGVRVIFSDPGTTADELIRRLVRGEPPGRPVIVVSSDAEVAASSRASGAYAVPSAALLRLLGGNRGG
jgi:predicted RNA-binding protein with PIN domain